MANRFTKQELAPARVMRVREVERSASGLSLDADAIASPHCPTCGTVSASRHSRYRRTVKDLPVQGVPVTFRVHLHRWRCRNRSCPQRIFVQRLPDVTVPHGRRTVRFDDVVRVVGHGAGGRPGERLMHRLGMGVSDDTLLRYTRRPGAGPVASLRVVGVDDWAWKKQQHYGTILVDLERGETVDVLAERSAAVLATWLTQHPGIALISRDRHGQYAEGAVRGAPHAEQIADRYHLIVNLREAVTQELNRQRQSLVLVPDQSGQTLPQHEDAPGVAIGACGGGGEPGVEDTAQAGCARPAARRAVSDVERHRRQVVDQRRTAKQALFDRVRRLHLAGRRVSHIVRETGLKRKRVAMWVRLTELPARNAMEPTQSSPSYFREYLAARWADGCRHGWTLWQEIRARGYTGCFSWLARFLQEWRCPRPSPEPDAATPPTPDSGAPVMGDRPARVRELATTSAPCDDGRRHVSPLVAAALLMKPRPLLTERQRQTVDMLKQACPDFATMRRLAMSFRGILLHGKAESLDAWVATAAATGIYALKRFVRTLRHDLAAVKNAVTYCWSNGPVEGHINRLKTLKRQMYGRAGVDLLRARMLPLHHLAHLHQL